MLGARDFGGTKAKQLFQLLVLARGEPVPKDRLADQIWRESLPVHVNATLETYVSVLRRKLSGANGEGRGLITTEHEAYALPTAGYDSTSRASTSSSGWPTSPSTRRAAATSRTLSPWPRDPCSPTSRTATGPWTSAGATSSA